ncbi:MAG TPA: aldehyde ferredoxin oxidoreductase, partial [candidate division WOR-3 bacterium]|nr:aldehyde ferredoxin oxidoreductase [candidate division WOR-3 bacterium]
MSKQIKGGYAGKTLWVDLSKNKILIKDLDPELAVNYIGGRGFVAKLLFDLVDPEKDPLDPQNPLVFTTGPLSGIAPASGRFTVGARSPATGIHGDSNSGGDFAMELK